MSQMDDLEEAQYEFRAQVRQAVLEVPSLTAQAEKYGGVDGYVDAMFELWKRRAEIFAKRTGENLVNSFRKTVVAAINDKEKFIPVLVSIDEQDKYRSFYRSGLNRKPDTFLLKIIDIPNDIILPKFEKLQDFKKFIFNLLDQGGEIFIKSTQQTCIFAHSGIKDSLKRAKNVDHRRSYLSLRKMVEDAEYDYSIWPDNRHSTEQDIYRSALRIEKNFLLLKLKLIL